MRPLRVFLVASLVLACGLQADAARRATPGADALAADQPQLMIGRLELAWGDLRPGAPANGRERTLFNAALVDDAGVRRALDTTEALRAADDLYALFGRRVAVSTVPVAAKAGGAPSRRIDAIVPVGDLVSSRTAGRRPLAHALAGGEKIAGVTTWVTLMCRFSDIATEQKPQSFFQGQYGTAIGQLDHYWQEVSYGQINLAGSQAYGWRSLPQPRSYYVTKDANGKDKADLGKLYTDCTTVFDPDVNFAVNGGVQGINMMFNGDLDGYAWGGGRCSTLDGINKCWSTTWNPPWSFNNLAPLSHEMGHAYGLPHANNSDADSDPYDNPWDVMSDAWNNGVSNGTYGTLPKHINIYSRNRLGWVAAARKLAINAGGGTTTVTVDRASLAGSSNVQMVTLNYPGQTTRYFTVEVRKRTGNYEANLAGNAVIIHEVQTGRSEPAWSMDADKPAANRANNEGSMFKVGERWVSADRQFCVAVKSETADGFVLDIGSRCQITGRPGGVQQTASAIGAAAPTGQSPRRTAPHAIAKPDARR
jgi:M6 family metalloprotease-like protein